MHGLNGLLGIQKGDMCECVYVCMSVCVYVCKYQMNMVPAHLGCILPTENTAVKKQLLKILLKLQEICPLEIIFRVKKKSFLTFIQKTQ